MTTARRKATRPGEGYPSSDTPPAALPKVDGGPGPGSKARVSNWLDTFAAWATTPNAELDFGGAEVPENVRALLEAAYRTVPELETAPAYTRNGETGLSTKQVVALGSPLSRARVTQRTEQGKQLSYLEAWDVKATLVKVFGFGGFSVDLLDTTILANFTKPQTRDPNKMNAVVVAQATVRLTIHATGATYTETATGQNAQPDVGKAFDTALKSAESDALKRAAVFLGTQFGLSLYGRTQDDVCRPILEPTQRQQIEEYVASFTTEDNDQTQKALDRATNRVDPNLSAEDAAAEDAAVKAADTAEGSQEQS
jgi:recombination DNA repair RAD52 pathway protein